MPVNEPVEAEGGSRLQHRDKMTCHTGSRKPRSASIKSSGSGVALYRCLKLEAKRPDLIPLMLTRHWLWAGLVSGFLFSRGSSQGGLAAEG